MVLFAEASVLLCDVALRADVLQAVASVVGLDERPVLREFFGILAFAVEDVGSDVLVDVVQLARILDAVVLADHRFGVSAEGEQVVLHVLYRVVIDEGDAPVAALVALTAPLEERRSVGSEVQTRVSREVILFRKVDEGVVRSVVRAKLDVDGVSRGGRRAEVVVVVQKASGVGVAERVAAASLGEEPDLCQRVVVLACAFGVRAVVGEADIRVASAGEAHDVGVAQDVTDVGGACEVAEVGERDLAEHPVAVAACAADARCTDELAVAVLQVVHAVAAQRPVACRTQLGDGIGVLGNYFGRSGIYPAHGCVSIIVAEAGLQVVLIVGFSLFELYEIAGIRLGVGAVGRRG